MGRLDALMKAAREENWVFVDRSISRLNRDSEYYKWAYPDGIRDPNDNIRDLAVSIIERSDIPEREFALMRKPLHGLMLRDSNRYVRFRAAFALANHGPENYREEVIEKLNEAAKDKEVKEIARDYLSKLRPKLRSRQ
jgi:HEAT repeat protein